MIATNWKEKLQCYRRLRIRKSWFTTKRPFNPNLEDQNYMFTVGHVKNIINIAKIIANSREFLCETGKWTKHKITWEEGICRVCNSDKVEDENNSLRMYSLHEDYISFSSHFYNH